MTFTDVLTASSLQRASIDDLCSQINYIYTAAMLCAMALFLSILQYAGDPIQCLCPVQLTEAQCNYTKALCWVKHNYFVHRDSPIQFNHSDRYDVTIALYPWVPWILASMAIALNAPNILWRSYLPSSGLDLKRFVDDADTHESLDNLARHILLWMGRRKSQGHSIVERARQTVGSWGFFFFARKRKTYLCGLLLATKLSYFLVSVGLFMSLKIFLDDEDIMFFGFDMIQYFLDGITFELTKFPLYTMCDIKVRQLNNIQDYSFQCVLPYNMYNQKIFIFLWFWFAIIIIVNIYSFLKWVLHLLPYGNRRSFVKSYVTILHHLLPKKFKHIRNQRSLQNHDPDSDGGASADAFRRPRVQIQAGVSSRDRDSISRADSRVSSPSHTDPVHDGAASSSSSPAINRLLSAVERFMPPNRPRPNLEGRGRPSLDGASPLAMEKDTMYDNALRRRKRHIENITTKMMQEFGHDGVVIFRTLETAVGVVISNRIFQELYEQLSN